MWFTSMVTYDWLVHSRLRLRWVVIAWIIGQVSSQGHDIQLFDISTGGGQKFALAKFDFYIFYKRACN